jgi:hypothetical protein
MDRQTDRQTDKLVPMPSIHNIYLAILILLYTYAILMLYLCYAILMLRYTYATLYLCYAILMLYLCYAMLYYTIVVRSTVRLSHSNFALGRGPFMPKYGVPVCNIQT